MDAATATMLCNGVLCPQYMGIGGGLLMSIYNGTTKKVMTIDARETAPKLQQSRSCLKKTQKICFWYELNKFEYIYVYIYYIRIVYILNDFFLTLLTTV